MLVEQAIFASAPGDWCCGYRLTAQSPGIDAADARELTAWGPGPDSLLERGEDAASINFFPLVSGSFCISKTTPVEGKRGEREQHVLTHCLVVPPETLERYGNNPFAVLNAAFAQGLFREQDGSSGQLEPFYLAGKASAVDLALVAGVRSDPGIAWFEALVESAVSSRAVAIGMGPHRPRLIAALFSCLPVEVRTGFSFSSGLKNSARRPFRIFCVGDQAAEHRHLLRQESIAVLQLDGNSPRRLTRASGWSGFISCALAAGRTEFLAKELSRTRIGLEVGGLNALGDELLELLAETSGNSTEAPAATTDAASEPTPSVEPASPPADEASSTTLRADVPHPGVWPAGEMMASSAAVEVHADIEPDPAQVIGRLCPKAVDKLEQLDDLVFEAIAGKPGALAQVKQLWPIVLAEVGRELVEESREQYLRHAMKVWRECVAGDEIHNPELAVAAIDVVAVLIEPQ